jgi:GTPase SAR1 family protein
MNIHNIFLFGLKNAGKKSVKSLLKNQENLKSESSLSMRINNMILKDIRFQIWEGEDLFEFQDLWNQYISKPKILLFILDVSDTSLFNRAKKALSDVLNDYNTEGIPLVFCFHKMDVIGSKENYIKARDFFELQYIVKRKIYALQTSIKNSEDITLLRNQLVEIIESTRWG